MDIKIKNLTPEQKAAMPAYRDEWIKKGLQTGKTDWATFDKYMPVCYEKAKLKYPSRIVRVQSPLVGALAASIANAIWKKYGRSVRDAVGGAVGNAVSNAVHGAVHVAVRGAVDGAVGNAVSNAVYDAVGGAVGNAVSNAVHDAVGNAVRDAVGNAVSNAKLEWHYWLGGQFWVGGWYWGVAFVNFFFDVCGLKLDKDIMERAEAYRKVCESVNYIWPNSEFIMVCARPIRICRNESGQLHSDQVKAIEYPDGWGLYALDGVILPEDLWKRIISKTMTFKEIMAIEISDQRTVALKYNPEAVIKENAVLVDKSDRGNELFKIENQQLNKDLDFKTIWFLRMKCPTGRTFVEGVPPEAAAAQPKADVMQALLCGLTYEEYQSLKFES